MTAIVKTQDLSPAARAALTNVGTSRQGATVPAGTDEVFRELKDAGLIGPLGGLTMAGTIVRDRIQDEDLDALFG